MVTARMRRVGVGGSPVPWLAMAAAVLVVIALCWLTTEDPLAAQSRREVRSFDASPTTVGPTDDDPSRPFSGQAAVEALLIDPGAGFTRGPDGSGGIGPRTEESIVSRAQARGDSADATRASLRAATFLGGVTRAWGAEADESVLVIILDEFATIAGARRNVAEIEADLEDEDARSAVRVDDIPGSRYDRTNDGTVEHYASFVIQRGRRVALVSVTTEGAIDMTTVEGHVRAQAARLEQAAP